ncbi:Protein of unknown function [Bacillus mycoides]|uniref:Uncharacterized protein n=1 Tax=Bacillus mycoides TaxID=1405 RepID=A0A1G4EXG7_BACMY|nr:Protein of unknown function [Bacillus mycoides]
MESELLKIYEQLGFKVVSSTGKNQL